MLRTKSLLSIKQISTNYSKISIYYAHSNKSNYL